MKNAFSDGAVSEAKYNDICRRIVESSALLYFDLDYDTRTVFYSYVDSSGLRQMKTFAMEEGDAAFQRTLHPDFSLSIANFREEKALHGDEGFRFMADFYGNGYRWYCARIVYMQEEGEAANEIIGTIADIDGTERKIRGLQKRADSDSMTGLYNRIATETMINEALMGAGGVGALFMIDIDNFKKVNDTMGHHAGDLLIRAASACIAGVFREDDIVGRVGGDEFVAFAPLLVKREHVEKKAKKIVEAIHNISIPGMRTNTCSVGAAVLGGGMHTFEDAFKLADKALYQAKQAGKDSYSVTEERNR